MHYESKITREAFQLGIWKVDHFGVGRVKDEYFTPTTKRVLDLDFTGFRIANSLDLNTIVLVESFPQDIDKILVLTFDAFTLKMKTE